MIDWFAQRIAYLATLTGVKFGFIVTTLFPHRWLFELTDGLAGLGFYFFRGFRRRSLMNISLALGNQLAGTADEIARKSLRNFFRCFVEIIIAMKKPVEEHRREIPLEGQRHLDDALAKQKGVIVLSAHLGNFFLVGERLAAEGFAVNMLVNQPRYGRFAELLDYYRLRVGQKTIHARPRSLALRELLQALRKNEVTLMIADEFRDGAGVPVSFFGRTVLARRGPATLAARTNAPIVPACLVRESDGNLRLVIEPELELLREEKTNQEIRENTQRLTQWLEKTVRQYSDQWNWMTVHWQDSADPAEIVKQRPLQSLPH